MLEVVTIGAHLEFGSNPHIYNVVILFRNLTRGHRDCEWLGSMAIPTGNIDIASLMISSLTDCQEAANPENLRDVLKRMCPLIKVVDRGVWKFRISHNISYLNTSGLTCHARWWCNCIAQRVLTVISQKGIPKEGKSWLHGVANLRCWEFRRPWKSDVGNSATERKSSESANESSRCYFEDLVEPQCNYTSILPFLFVWIILFF